MHVVDSLAETGISHRTLTGHFDAYVRPLIDKGENDGCWTTMISFIQLKASQYLLNGRYRCADIDDPSLHLS